MPPLLSLVAAAMLLGLVPAGAAADKACPPGLQKQGRCAGADAPPGIAKRYTVGDPLAAGIDFRRIPDFRDLGLGSPGDGRVYVEVDGDILLMAEATRVILDVIRAAGR